MRYCTRFVDILPNNKIECLEKVRESIEEVVARLILVTQEVMANCCQGGFGETLYSAKAASYYREVIVLDGVSTNLMCHHIGH